MQAADALADAWSGSSLPTGRIANPRFLWPPSCTISIYLLDGTRVMRTKDRTLDLADSRAFHGSTILFGIATRSARWTRWNEDNLARVEELIRYDLGFEGYRVWLRRKSPVGLRSPAEFRWSVTVRPR